MFRRILIVLLFVQVFSEEKPEVETEAYYTCSAWADPHVTRFPSDRDEKPAEVWCKQSGLHTLLSNKYIDVHIGVGGEPYYIKEFNVDVLEPGTGEPLCTITPDSFKNTINCREGVTVERQGNTITIDYRNHDIFVYITQFDWKQQIAPYTYNIIIKQGSYLIPESHGICKTSCDPNTGAVLRRRARAATNDANPKQNAIKKSAEKLCESFVAKIVPTFKIASLNRMSIYAKNAYSSCVTDLRLTGDVMFAKSSIDVLAVTLATKDVSRSTDIKKILKEVHATIDRTNGLIDAEISKLTDSEPSSGKGDYTFTYNEKATTAISCRQTWSGLVKITSAKFESQSGSCSVNVTPRVQELCGTSKRICQFVVSNAILQNDRCKEENKQLKGTYQCV